MSEKPIEAQEDAGGAVNSASERMRAAREAAGMSLKDVAETTRVPLRHLASLEEGDFAALPGTTYCAGFARAYARAVGMDEASLVSQIKAEIDEMGGVGQGAYEFEEAVNPARVPPRWLAWAGAALVVVLAAGYGLWRTQLNTPPTDEQIAVQTARDAIEATPDETAGPAAPTLPRLDGPVVMTAADDVWMRIYQPDGTRLYEGTLKRGESYTVPDSARDPMILTGRPDVLAVTVGGQAVPPLGTAERTISDVPVSATALLERAGQGTAEGAAGTAPMGSVTTPSTAAPRSAPAVRAPAAPSPRPADNAAAP
ncbi:MAG TPA: RodZ domain-containing protein [Sphingobium sp.]|nr:RodZ domain-containing protein [Sphingobium sp.]